MRLENILEKDEVLLSHIQTYPNNYEDQQLCLTFRNLGDVYVPHLHTYSSVPLSHKVMNELETLINQEKIGTHDNPLYPYRNSIKKKDHYFNILQIKAPKRISSDIQKIKYNSKKEKFEFTKLKGRKKLFRSGHFDEQARWNIGYHDKDKDENDLNYEHCLQPGTIYKTDDILISTLKKKKELEDLHYEIKKNVRDFKKQHPERNFKGDIVAKLRTSFIDFKNIEDARLDYKWWTCKKHWKGINNTNVVDLTKLLVEKEKEFRNEIKNYANLEYFEDSADHESNKYRLYLNKRSNFKKNRQLTFDEWMGLKYIMIDIETPKFIEGNDEITQVSACLVEYGEIKKRKLFNKELVDIVKINDHTVHSGYRTQEDLVDAINDWIAEENVDVMMAYNNAFDFDKLKKAGMKTSKNSQTTRQRVTLPFFKKFYMGDGFCMDLMNISRTLLGGFPNAKLEMFSRFLFGDKGYHKKITYQEMFELQKISEGGYYKLKPSTINKMEKHSGKCISDIMKNFEYRKKLASEMILDYVSEDTDTMYYTFFDNELVQRCLKHAKKAAEIFDMNFINLIDSPNSMKEPYNRGYEKHVGINRSEIYMTGMPQFDKIAKANKQAFKDYIDDLFGYQNQEGTFNNVERRFIPTHILLKDAGLYTSKKVNQFLEYVNDLFKGQKCCPNELIFASKYVGGLLSYLEEDFGSYARRKKGFDTIIDALEAQMTPLFKTNKNDYIRSAQKVLDLITDINIKSFEVEESGLSPEQYHQKVKSMQIRDFVKNLKKIPKFKEFVRNNEEEDFVKMMLKENLELEDLYDVFHSFFDVKKQKNKISGHYRIDIVRLKNMLDNGLKIEKEKLAVGKDTLFMKYPFMITKDRDPNVKRFDDVNYSALFPLSVHEESIKLPIQTTLDTIYISKNKYYSKEHGFYKGIDFKSEPSYSTTVEFSDFQERALKHFLNYEFEQGAEVVLKCINTIKDKLDSFDSNKESDLEKLKFLNYNKKNQYFKGFQDGKRYCFTKPGVYKPDNHDKYRSFFYHGFRKDSKGKKIKKIVYINRDKKTGFNYFDLPGKKQNTRVFIHDVGNYNPDYRALLECGKNKFRDFSDAAINILAKNGKIELAHELKKALKSKKPNKINEDQLEFEFN